MRTIIYVEEKIRVGMIDAKPYPAPVYKKIRVWKVEERAEGGW